MGAAASSATAAPTKTPSKVYTGSQQQPVQQAESIHYDYAKALTAAKQSSRELARETITSTRSSSQKSLDVSKRKSTSKHSSDVLSQQASSHTSSSKHSGSRHAVEGRSDQRHTDSPPWARPADDFFDHDTDEEFLSRRGQTAGSIKGDDQSQHSAEASHHPDDNSKVSGRSVQANEHTSDDDIHSQSSDSHAMPSTGVWQHQPSHIPYPPFDYDLERARDKMQYELLHSMIPSPWSYARSTQLAY